MGFAVFFIQVWHLWGLVLKAPLLLSPLWARDKTGQDLLSKLALFSQFGSFPISYADLEMKSLEWGLWRDDRAVSPSSRQSWSLMPLCLSLAVNLLSFQPITGSSCLLLIVSLQLKFVITYWCMASWWLWAWTALAALTALCFPGLCLRSPVVELKIIFILDPCPATYFTVQRGQDRGTTSTSIPTSIILQSHSSASLGVSMAAFRNLFSWGHFHASRGLITH